jgi:DNA-binding MarR family transcriptional regulator
MDITKISTYQAGVSLASATRNVHKIFTTLLRDHGVTCMQWFVLGTIFDSGSEGIKLSLLSDKLQTGLPFITNTINLLESKGWVERRGSLIDSRSKCVSVTDEARQKIHDIEADLRNRISTAVYRECSRDELTVFMEVLQGISKVAEETPEPDTVAS